MILVDTSIWMHHLRAGEEQLSTLLGDGEVLGHPFVTGELALGNLVNRVAVISAASVVEAGGALSRRNQTMEHIPSVDGS